MLKSKAYASCFIIFAAAAAAKLAMAESAVIKEALSLDVTFTVPNNGVYSYYYKGRLTTLDEYHRVVRQDAAKLGFKVLDFKVVHVGIGSASVEPKDGRASWAYRTSHRVVPNLVPTSAL